jgi:RND family efflux transporter MFP subunit
MSDKLQNYNEKNNIPEIKENRPGEHLTDSIDKMGVSQQVLIRGGICFLILLAGVIIAAVFFSMRPKPQKKTSEELVRVLQAIKIKTQDIRLQVTGYGTAEPIREVMLSAELKGRIVMKSTDLKEGMLVEKDQVLARIDVSDYEIALMEAKAEITRLNAEREQLKQYLQDTHEQLAKEIEILKLYMSDYKRQKELAGKGIAATKAMEEAQRNMVTQRKVIINTQTDLNQKKIQQATIDAQLQRALAEKKMAQINIERSVIKSPFRGRVKQMFIDNGEYVQAGTKLFDIADDTQLEIPVSLDAYDVAKILGLKSEDQRKYMNWFQKPASDTVQVEWVEDPALCCWTGSITRIKNFDPETRTITFVVRPKQFMKGRKGYFPIVSGMFCKVIFQGLELKNAVKVPWVAIQLDGDAYVVSKDGRLEERKIEIFSIEGSQAIISSGLKDGDLLIVQRLPRGLVNGMKVKPINPIDGSYHLKEAPVKKEQIAPLDKSPQKRQGIKDIRNDGIRIAAR